MLAVNIGYNYTLDLDLDGTKKIFKFPSLINILKRFSKCRFTSLSKWDISKALAHQYSV
jgi:hypothetical protein